MIFDKVEYLSFRFFKWLCTIHLAIFTLVSFAIDSSVVEMLIEYCLEEKNTKLLDILKYATVVAHFYEIHFLNCVNSL